MLTIRITYNVGRNPNAVLIMEVWHPVGIDLARFYVWMCRGISDAVIHSIRRVL